MSGTDAPAKGKSLKELDRAVIRFAGDSGDGMQLTGEQFTTESAWAGNDIATLPNFPAEIRAPAGTLFGVSSFQLQFGSQRVYTPGDRLDCLVAMNPAALKVHLRDLKPGGLLIVNTAAFEKRNLRSEEHTSELQSLTNLVCRLLLEKKKKRIKNHLRGGSGRISVISIVNSQLGYKLDQILHLAYLLAPIVVRLK